VTPDKPWFLSRGGQTVGPYPFQQLQQWAAARQLAPEDVVWQDGMPSWVPAGSLPGLFPAVASPGAAVFSRALFHLKRAGEWNLRAVVVRPEEEQALIAVGVDDPAARTYHAWRRSVLLVVATAAAITAAVGIVTAATQDTQAFSDIGKGLEVVNVLVLFVTPFAASRAAATWTRHRRSRRAVVIGWSISFLATLLLSMIPLHWRLNLEGVSPTDPQFAVVRLYGAVDRFVTLGPVVLALFPGVLRACLRVKVLLPQSILPGWFLVAASPVYMVLFFLFFVTVNQVASNELLVMGVLAVAGAPLAYMVSGSLFTRPLAPGPDYARLIRVQWVVRVVFGIGVGFLLLWLFTGDVFGRRIIGVSAETSLVRPWNTSLLEFPVHYLASSLFTMTLVADLIMLMNLSLWLHTKAFMQSPEAKEYDRAMSEIEEAGARE
jgi:hypothetical protein